MHTARSLRHGFPVAVMLLSRFSTAQALGESACLALNQSLQLPNTTLLNVSYVPANTTIETAGSCQSTALSTSAMCRLYFVTQTSNDSAIHAEMWLPDDHNGRFLALGNGGLGGCEY
jgi:feruloyl esterase